MSDKFLSAKELIELTGYRQPSKQIAALRSRGIEPIHKPDNSLSVLWKWVENIGNNKAIEQRPKLRSIK